MASASATCRIRLLCLSLFLFSLPMLRVRAAETPADISHRTPLPIPWPEMGHAQLATLAVLGHNLNNRTLILFAAGDSVVDAVLAETLTDALASLQALLGVLQQATKAMKEVSFLTNWRSLDDDARRKARAALDSLRIFDEALAAAPARGVTGIPPYFEDLGQLRSSVLLVSDNLRTFLGENLPNGKATTTQVPQTLYDLEPMFRMLGGVGVRYSVLADDSMPSVAMEPDKVVDILLNVVRNAGLSTPENGRVQVRAFLAEPRVMVVEVHNTGSYIPPELRTKIFEAGFSTRGAAGHGLGLYSVKAMLEAAGGSVTVDSSEVGGTSFRLWFPVAVPGFCVDLLVGRPRQVALAAAAGIPPSKRVNPGDEGH